MKIEENRNNFVFPRSYVGRAILYMFTVPFVSVILGYVYSFVAFVIKAGFRFYGYAQGTIERPRELCYKTFSLELFASIKGYIRHIVISLMGHIYTYFDALVTLGAYALVAWFVLRYTRNRPFNQTDWFKTFVYAIGLFVVITFSRLIFAYLDGLCGSFTDFALDELPHMLFLSAKYVVYGYIAYIFFLKTPYECEPLWKNDYKPKEFISHNLKVFLRKAFDIAFSKNVIKVVLWLLCLLVIDVIYWYCKTR